jgi:hypothetical protein
VGLAPQKQWEEAVVLRFGVDLMVNVKHYVSNLGISGRYNNIGFHRMQEVGLLI